MQQVKRCMHYHDNGALIRIGLIQLKVNWFYSINYIKLYYHNWEWVTCLIHYRYDFHKIRIILSCSLQIDVTGHSISSILRLISAFEKCDGFLLQSVFTASYLIDSVQASSISLLFSMLYHLNSKKNTLVFLCRWLLNFQGKRRFIFHFEAGLESQACVTTTIK